MSNDKKEDTKDQNLEEEVNKAIQVRQDNLGQAKTFWTELKKEVNKDREKRGLDPIP